MSYAQYDQYGGNPYNNGPSAENGQGGVSKLSLGSLEAALLSRAPDVHGEHN